MDDLNSIELGGTLGADKADRHIWPASGQVFLQCMGHGGVHLGAAVAGVFYGICYHVSASFYVMASL